MSAVKQTTYQGFAAWALESEHLLAIVIPELGGKIISLVDKRAGYEWLVQPRRPLKPPTYGASFVEGDMSGWDEMFPTINPCSYPIPGAYAGRWLPDHGEVWSLPWSVQSADQGCLKLSVDGRALPYRLNRSAALIEPNALKLKYEVVNTGREPFYYLWAAHPQLNADEHSQILLPEEVSEVVNVLPLPAWGEPGLRYRWPETRSLDGKLRQLDRIGPVDRRDCRKFYLPPEKPVRWAALNHQRSGCSLKLEWSPLELPYLGIWVDEGAYNSAPAAALEPSNGYYDSLVVAVRQERAMRIAPGASQGWSLTIRLTHTAQSQ